MSAWGVVPEGMVCQHCGERPATGMWTGDEGIVAALHGAYSWWCEQCMVVAQLERARERAATIPELERRLAEIDAEGAP